MLHRAEPAFHKLARLTWLNTFHPSGPSKSRYSATSAAGVQGHLFELPVLPLIFSRCQRATQRIPRPLRSPSCQQLDLCTSLMLRDAEETSLEIDRFYLKFLSYRNGINLMCWTVVPSILLTNQSDSIADCAPVVGGDILLLNVSYFSYLSIVSYAYLPFQNQIFPSRHGNHSESRGVSMPKPDSYNDRFLVFWMLCLKLLTKVLIISVRRSLTEKKLMNR